MALAAGHARVLAGAGIDLVCLGDDVGMPGTMMMSPATWRRYLRPHMAEIIRAAREAAPGVRVLHHSGGCIEPILGDW